MKTFGSDANCLEGESMGATCRVWFICIHFFMSYGYQCQKLLKFSSSSSARSTDNSQFSIPSLSPYLQKKAEQEDADGEPLMMLLHFKSVLSNFHSKMTHLERYTTINSLKSVNATPKKLKSKYNKI